MSTVRNNSRGCARAWVLCCANGTRSITMLCAYASLCIPYCHGHVMTCVLCAWCAPPVLSSILRTQLCVLIRVFVEWPLQHAEVHVLLSGPSTWVVSLASAIHCVWL